MSCCCPRSSSSKNPTTSVLPAPTDESDDANLLHRKTGSFCGPGSSLKRDSGDVDGWWQEYDEEHRRGVFGLDPTVTTGDGIYRPSFSGFCSKIKKGEIDNLVVMIGGGVSKSAGVQRNDNFYKDLRKNNGGEKLEKLFSLDYFSNVSSKPFNERCKKLMPGNYKNKPSKTHYFLKLLHSKKLIHRIYTQNIDTLEKLAGIPDDAVVYANGNFGDVTCGKETCKKRMRLEEWKKLIEGGEEARCSDCSSLVHPSLVFSGDPLAPRFGDLANSDFRAADCLLVIGSSLSKAPFNGLVGLDMGKGGLTPRVLINKSAVGLAGFHRKDLGPRIGFRFNPDVEGVEVESGEEEEDSGSKDGAATAAGSPGISDSTNKNLKNPSVTRTDYSKNFRDLFLPGDCDYWALKICSEMGWRGELEKLIEQGDKDFESGELWKKLCRDQPKEGDSEGGGEESGEEEEEETESSTEDD